MVVLVVKNPPANAGDLRDMRLISGFGKIPWRRTWQPTLIVLPGESHGQRRLADYSPQGRNELNMTEVTSHTIFIVAAPFYSPTKNLGGFNFLHILTSICYCLFYFSHLVAVNIGPMNVSSQEEICLIGKYFLLWLMFSLS